MVRTKGFFGMAMVGIGLCAALAQSSSAPATMTAEQELELGTLRQQLADPQRESKTRLEAARMLLAKPYPQAGAALRQFLSDRSNVGAQLAVAEAIAEDGYAREDFIEPLLAMLLGDEPLVRPSAARALVTYQNPLVADRLIAIAQDRTRDRAVRRVTIEALPRIVSKTCIEALIGLLGDPDPTIRSVAADSLQRMTHIRRFGHSRGRWEAWWKQNRQKEQVAWLEEMTDGLTRANLSLEKENAQLRNRLIQALESMYNASSKSQRSEWLLSFLSDSLSDVRLLGETLTDRMLAANETVPAEIRQRIRMLLFDDDSRVRQSAATLESALADEKTTDLLLGRLRAEQSPEVRVSLLKALGRLKSPKALPALLVEIRSQDDDEATAAAAEALRRIATEAPLNSDDRRQAGLTLIDRYQRSVRQKNATSLRESLLTAMGAVGGPDAETVLTEALRDPAAVVRLAGVDGLAHLGAKDAVAAIAPLVQDEDRGVRQAAISALVQLGAKGYLQTILRQTNPKIEPDPAVRQEAEAGVLAICQNAEAQALKDLFAMLPQQAASVEFRIQVLQILAEALRAEKAPGTPKTLRTLGTLLVEAGRADEAAPILAEAWTLLQADPDRQRDAREVWFEYVGALLSANDPAVIRVLREQKDQGLYAKALGMLLARLRTLRADEDDLALLALAGGAIKQLSDRLSSQQKRRLSDLWETARNEQRALDRQNVEKLLPGLLAADAPTREEARVSLKAMGPRAARPLLEKLKEIVSSDMPDAQREEAIWGVLQQIAPDLGPYDPADEKAQRLSNINAWLETVE